MQKSKLTKSALYVGVALASTSAIAANSWLSRVNTVDQQQYKKVLTAQKVKSIPAVSTDSSKAVFDITVSLHNNPEGSEKVVYEEIFSHFADAVCEQTNGEHKLGKINVFRENKHRSKSDIIWGKREWPRANASGFGANGMHIWFGDVFPNGSGPGIDHNMLHDPQGAGYTLAHEWSHYAYGLFDEYQGIADSAEPNTPIKSDAPTTSIMSNQWQALTAGMQWLNHSTKDTIGNIDLTAQGRIYGKSAWEVLLQDVKDDPKTGRKTAQPSRTRFLTLADNAPDLDTPLKIKLPAERDSCQNQLDVVWIEGDIDMQVVVDRSYSMLGPAMSNAKKAAKTLVDATAEGSTSMGLVSFSSDDRVQQDYPVTKIESSDSSVKNELKAAIDAIYENGSTALYDGLQLALDNLTNYQYNKDSNAPGVVFILADGYDNDSSYTQEQIIANYQNSNITIFSLGYGFASPTGPLLTIANETGGKYFSSPTTLTEIVDTFLQANATATDNQNLASSTFIIDSLQSVTQVIAIDSGLDNLNIFINFNANPDDLQLTLLNSIGNEVSDVAFNCNDAAETLSCSVYITNQHISLHGTGEWQLQITSLNDVDSLTATVNVSAEPSLSGSYTLSVEGSQGNAVIYPSPMILTAAITKDKLITGANVLATITDPNQTPTDLKMFDNGLEGDAVAGDGIYSVIAPYNENGIYQVEVNVNNDDDNAIYTTTGLLTPTRDGSVPEMEALPSIDENFIRIAKASLVVSDVPRSDYNDKYYFSDQLISNNADKSGVIDGQSDLDFYEINDIDTTKELVVRVTNLSLGMTPNLNLYKSDGTTPIKENITLQSNPSKTGYVYYKIDQSEVESKIYAAVKHQDPNARMGGYQISTGEPIYTDVTINNIPSNNAPEVKADTISALSGEVTVIKPLDNDSDLDGDTLVIDSIRTDGTIGLVTLAQNEVTYDASSAFSDQAPGTVVTDSFIYIVTDNKGAFVEGKVIVTVTIPGEDSEPVEEPDKVSSRNNDSGSLFWLTMMLTPLSLLRRRKK
ncbi:VWA domain-containing protein [Pseudoalteromonas sp. NEC-BIFX-2020_002]|uniref:VWA domain-containing protein n=1 Tax=Pseudoalteromonas sp. NEC-BIFX-2020_002 TaxID=2732353 RepID=UPI0032D5836B